MRKLDRKGFTLVELLATIAILALVVGFSTYGIITAVNNSKDEAIAISNQSIKDAARIYSGEASSDSWKDIDGYDDKYFCVTVRELINKGLLKEIDVSDKIDTSTYVAVSKNKVTEVIKKEEILKETNTDIYKICTGSIKNEEEEILRRPEIISAISSYTDQITVKFEEGDAIYDGESSVSGYECKYGIYSSNLSSSGTVDENNNTCILSGLKNNTTYHVSVYMKTNKNSYISSDNKSFKSADFVIPVMSSNDNIVNINYDHSTVLNPAYYFRSSVDTEVDVDCKQCSLNGTEFSCNSSSTKNITADKWYKISADKINLKYLSNTYPNVEAWIYDGSNNYASNKENYSFDPETVTYNIKFYKNGATSINGSTDDFVNLSCTAKVGESCSITAPSIVREGYDIIGWNTSNSATNSEWNVNTSKSINSDAVYYAITAPKKYTVIYDANGGTGVPSSQEKDYGVNLTLSTDIPSRVGYTFTGWNTMSDGSGTNYYSGGTYKDNSNVTLYAQWKKNKVIIRYNTNGASNITESNNGGRWSIVDGFVYLNDNEFKTNIYYNSLTSDNGLSDYNNDSYMYISREGYAASYQEEWICLEGCKTDNKKYDQTKQYAASDFCNAADGDCTVVLGVNWFKTVINGRRYDQTTKSGHTAVYYITTCPNMEYCYYNTLNGLLFDASNTNNFANDIIVPFASGKDKSYANRPNLVNKLTGGNDMYISTSAGLKCRPSASTSIKEKYTAGCGKKVHVYRTTMATSADKNYWWYYNEIDDCYFSGEFLTSSSPSCSSGGSGSGSSGPSCKDEIMTELEWNGGSTYYCCEKGAANERVCTSYTYNN